MNLQNYRSVCWTDVMSRLVYLVERNFAERLGTYGTRNDYNPQFFVVAFRVDVQPTTCRGIGVQRVRPRHRHSSRVAIDGRMLTREGTTCTRWRFLLVVFIIATMLLLYYTHCTCPLCDGIDGTATPKQTWFQDFPPR